MDEAIKNLSREHTLFVLSSNSTDNVKAFLELNEINVYFSGVFGDVNPLSKKRRLKELIKQNSLSIQETWYVGDEILDIKAAKYVGIKSIAVTWGFSDIHRLETNKPDQLIFNPDELCALFNIQ